MRLPPGSRFVVGGDVRHSTPVFLDALARGLALAGMQVLELGVAPTPVVYFAMRHTTAPGCAIVTASHSPPGLNGLKWMLGGLPPSERDVQSLRPNVESTARDASGRNPGARRGLRVDGDYAAWLGESWKAAPVDFSPTVVLDPGHGTWSMRAAHLLAQTFPRARTSAVHDSPDGSFPGRSPDSADPSGLAALAAAVVSTGADIGIAFDGDGDRVAFLDDEGQVLSAEATTWILLRSLGPEMRQKTFVYDVKFSDCIPQTAEALGARARAQRSGHAFIRSSMIQDQARFGAEISGHYFYSELEGGDDALFTACRMLAYLAGCGQPLHQLRTKCPQVHITPDLRVAVAPREQEEMLRRVDEAFPGLPRTRVDGVRVDFEEGWALVRRSVTEPSLTFRFEGTSEASLERVVARFCEELTGLGEDVYEEFRSSRGGVV